VKSTQAWLDPLRNALDGGSTPVACFFRDDDVGWRHDRLGDLLDLFAELGLPLDLAAIPAALDHPAAHELRRRIERSEGRLGVHQHGYAHANHEPSGRSKCEFGPARSREAQLRDIAAGRTRLALMLGPAVEPIFTPPWNRCTAATAGCLVELGFETLSREASAIPLDVPGLTELPVGVDWFKRRGGTRLPLEEIAGLAAAAVESGGPVGVMFHHAKMDRAELDAAAELLTVLAEHERTRCVRMGDAVAGPSRDTSWALASENVNTVAAAIDAVNREDWDAAFRDMAPGFELDMSRAAGPGNGVYSLDETRLFVGDLASTWESVRIEPQEFIEAGDLVVVPWTMHASGREGIEVVSRPTFVCTIRDGLIERMCMYQERHEALEAVGR
jgi:ketosteroid isomerase-like protein